MGINKDIQVTFTLPGKFLDRVVEKCNSDKNIPVVDIINDELDLFTNYHDMGNNQVYKGDVLGDAVIETVMKVINNQIYKEDI